MSAKIEARQNAFVGRTVIAFAVAGLIGVAITFAVATSLLLSRGNTNVTAPGLSIQPGYDDFAQRHRGEAVAAPVNPLVIEPGYTDYWQRGQSVPVLKPAVPLEPGYVDLGQRNQSVTLLRPAPALEPGYEDYGQRQTQVQAPVQQSGDQDYTQRHSGQP
jgi:hypothetical protein